MLLRHVTSMSEIRTCIATFNNSAQLHPERTRRILKQTSYWVFDEKSKLFGPSKFVGFSEMTFQTYESAVRGNWSGDRFDGHATRAAIEAVSGSAFTVDRALAHDLVKWGKHVVPGAFVGIDESKWCFLKI